MLGCEAKSAIAWDDPMPILRSVLFSCLPKGGAASHRFELHKQAG